MDILKKLDETFGDQPIAIGTAKLLYEQMQLRARITQLESLALHLRNCRECGETDVAYCHEGRELWNAAMSSTP